MEIRDPIHGNIEIPPNIEAVIEHPAFQRLRFIKQLGFGEFSFPGATHNRYLHSIGTSHLAGMIFDTVFRGYPFPKPTDRWRLRECTLLAALLHDIGHGPLSHTTEEVMPQIQELEIPFYKDQKKRKATHEDYTIKFVTDSDLALTLKHEFPDLDPVHIACLIDRNLDSADDFFVIDGINLRPVLTQMISSELDADRMDYLLRDSYFTGTSYGNVDMTWLLANMGHHIQDGNLHLALNRKALYTFDDFLISRHHMYLQVYFHHKSIVYDEMLLNFLSSEDCDFFLPSNIDQYLEFNDSYLYEHLKNSQNYWARLISQRRPFRILFELHNLKEENRMKRAQEILNDAKIPNIYSSSQSRLSKYHATMEENAHKIFVIDQYNSFVWPVPIEETTEIFQAYERKRSIDRLYVPPKMHKEAEELIRKNKVLS